MNLKTKVTLILADRVRSELKLLDQAENSRESHSKASSIASAMRGVREALNVQVMNAPTTMGLTINEIELCKHYFRDVGENTFVFEETQMLNFKQALTQIRLK